jgi:hypothetical protein
MSGIYAVHLTVAVDRGKATPSQAAEEYRRWIGELFDRTGEELKTLPNYQWPSNIGGLQKLKQCI